MVGSAHTGIDQSYPSFGFTFAAVDSTFGASGEAAIAAPAATATPALQLGPSPAERRQEQDSSRRLFGVVGVTFMATSNALQDQESSRGLSVTIMVDSGSSGHFFHPLLVPDSQRYVKDCKILEEPHRIYGVGDHQLEGIASGTICGTVIDAHGRKVEVNFKAIVVPDLKRNHFSVNEALKKGVATVFDTVRPRLEVGHVVLPLNQNKGDGLHFFTIDLAGKGDVSGVALRAESVSLWHRRVGHITGRSMDILRKVQGNGVEYNGELNACDVCTIGQRAQQAHPKRSSYDVSRPFQLVTTDLMGPFSPPALGGFLYINKFVDQHTKWNKVFLIKEKGSRL